MSDQGVRRRDFALRLVERSVAEFLDDHCPQYASSIAYHVLFSIFPLAIALAAVFAIFVHVTGTRADVVDAIVHYLPLSADGDRRLRQLLVGATGDRSALGLVGLAGVVYGASGMMASIRLALDEAWDVTSYRPFLKGKLVDVGLVFAAAALALASIGITFTVRIAGGTRWGGGSLGANWADWVLGVGVPLVTAFAVILFLYRVIPAAEVTVADSWVAAAFSACAFVLLENLFALYAQHFANYNAVYGSLGAVIAFMFFVYLSSLAFLLGAEVASEWPRVRRELQQRAAEEGEEQGPGFGEQVRRVIKGLWFRQP